ncbi:hypothetical protein GCM10009715_08100 [Paeniglutamicibacter psychrophenolicus]
MGLMSDENRNMAENEEPGNNLTPNTDEREVSEKQLSKWKSEGGALSEDFDTDAAPSDSGQ